MVRLDPEHEGGRPSSARMAVRVFHTKPTYSRKNPQNCPPNSLGGLKNRNDQQFYKKPEFIIHHKIMLE
jgi:hypothetical protein